jgi:hypothetical protein
MSETISKNDELLELEYSLKHKLNPVHPRKDFVGALRQRLVDFPTYKDKRRAAATLLSIALGLLTGLVIFLIGRQFIHDGDEA